MMEIQQSDVLLYVVKKKKKKLCLTHHTYTFVKANSEVMRWLSRSYHPLVIRDRLFARG